ncbi:LamG domain-containing protein [Gloeothece verrucosa]|uniref:LamG domain-containing protein n=1 Tax=Gloeothece verrucosa (strain PCC 7822) TaxID=497965 RepID=E0ULS8_GLOV7|nr:LamG domain-containing protein [Gloeothece verrucosa]ADN17908.1 LamG domain-containing protein [Gloeothece verrucosa PCC 7822]
MMISNNIDSNQEIATLVSSESSSNTEQDFALAFDGVDDYVSIPHSSNLSLNNFTVEAWINPNQIKGDWQPLITKEASNGTARNYGLFIVPNEMRIHFVFLDIYGVWRYDYSVKSLQLNQWNHIAMTYDGNKFNFYLNGVLDKSLNFWRGDN